MTEFLQDLLGVTQSALSGAILVFLRVGAVMALLPAFGERSVPPRVRLVLALAFTIPVVPLIAAEASEVLGANGMLAAGAAEVVAGLAIGICFRLMVLTLQIAGTIAANVMSLSQILGGVAVDPQPSMAHLLVVSGLALAVMSGLHVRVVEALVLSYQLFPVGRFPTTWELAGWGTERISHAFALSFVLSAPFVLVSVLYNLALGAINRAMPLLMVAFVGAPAITGAGLVMLALTVPGLLMVWIEAFNATLADFGIR